MNLCNALGDINWLAVGVAELAGFVLGGLWFTVLFGRAYAAALGKDSAPKGRPAPIFLIGPFVCGLVTVVTSAILIAALHITSMRGALAFGAVVGVGYLASTTVNVAINPNLPRPLFYGLISGSYFVLGSLLTSVILVAMK